MNQPRETVQPRKSLYMRIAPIIHTYDEVIKNKLETGKFPFTVTGIIKVLGMLFLIASFALFIATPTCENTSSWYPYLFPISIGICLGFILVFYVIFSSGATTERPAVWVKVDIGVNLCLAIIGICSSVASLIDCGKGVFSQIIIEIIGIIGCIISVIGCIGIFLMYRFVDEENTTQPVSNMTSRIRNARKSIFA
ncbi:hypothetical protein WA026_018633 [Henosepilachna vigintioctopunctata]|uniref:MARVEL domain-containing protein n=1 Tax=Henosepilachna vigintioctopunctata TaxID=420089 RepID=A0AAW1U123_9CUCU